MIGKRWNKEIRMQAALAGIVMPDAPGEESLQDIATTEEQDKLIAEHMRQVQERKKQELNGV